MAKARPAPEPIRIRRIWTPGTTLGTEGVILVGCTFLLALVLGVLIILSLRPLLGEDPSSIALTVLSVVSILITQFIMLSWANRLHVKKILSKPEFRTERLARLISSDPSAERIRHRRAEQLLRGKSMLTKSVVRQLFKVLRPGDLLIVNIPREEIRLAKQGNAIQFEPIDLDDDEDRLQSLVLEWKDTASDEAPGDSSDAGEAVRARPIRTMLATVFSWIWLLFWVLFLLRSTYVFVMNGASRESIPFMILAAVCIGSFLAATMFERKTWIVPGGLIYRYAPFYRKAPLVKYFRPALTPLLVDFRSGILLVSDKDREYQFACPELAAFAVVLAWSSTAPSPTDSEAMSFLGLLPSEEGRSIGASAS